MMTKYNDNQAVFDAVRTHFTKPGARLATIEPLTTPDNGNGCFYRDGKGNACAFGCLIPDEMYEPEMEGRSTDEVVTLWPEVRELFDESVDTAFLDELQSAHDESGSLSQFLVALDCVGENWELSV